MYETRRWDEKVMKWLAVGLCLAMVALLVAPKVGTVDLTHYITQNPSAYGLDEVPSSEVLTTWSIVVGVNGLLISTAIGGPVGFGIGLALAVGMPL